MVRPTGVSPNFHPGPCYYLLGPAGASAQIYMDNPPCPTVWQGSCGPWVGRMSSASSSDCCADWTVKMTETPKITRQINAKDKSISLLNQAHRNQSISLLNQAHRNQSISLLSYKKRASRTLKAEVEPLLCTSLGATKD
ncbi:hypothetical protein P7K49_008515 [Saguinus oedipus]|uniref:Uncharacterized protein n=1 Tax=Saguinus oedipus TaxID=9490 RepID=A0ABQ9VZK2_SAGOE|nr:hypothetical protein P7K49_008515 [Saguinus oedipus]